MEDFLKKHNFNKNIKIKNRRFNIVRYYPKIETYEFLNIGIIVYDNQDLYYKMLTNKEVSKLHCPILVESKVLKTAISDLEDFLQGDSSSKEIISKINNRYKNVLDTSFQLSYDSNEDVKIITNKLFNKYIGYKLEQTKVEKSSDKFRKKTNAIINSEFKEILEVKKSIVKGFSLDFYNKRASKNIHAIIGSINNSQDIFKAFNSTPYKIEENEKYNFLNAVDTQNIYNQEKLARNGIDSFRYSTDDDIYEYCIGLVG